MSLSGALRPSFRMMRSKLKFPRANTTSCVGPVSSDKVTYLHLVGQRHFSLNIDIFWLTVWLKNFAPIPSQICPLRSGKAPTEETKQIRRLRRVTSSIT